MQIPLTIDRATREPLTEQLTRQLRELIRQRRIPAGARLPSSRELALQFEIARNTAVRVYELLTAEGYVETRAASGVYAAVELPSAGQRRAARAAADTPAATPPTRMPMPIRPPHALLQAVPERPRVAHDFAPGRASAALFPIKAMRRMIQTALTYRGATGFSHYGEPAGLHELRKALAMHLSMTRGIVASIDQILIVGGIQEGLSIACRMFLAPGALAVVESPGYHGAILKFEACGADVMGVPVDDEGLVTDALPEETVALLHTTPSHQFPCGHTMSLARRQALIGWARRQGCYILEDDYDGDFHYERAPLQAIAGMAPDCAFHLGSFSKTLGAGLRLGYMVVPAHLAEAARDAKALLNNGSAWLEQAVLADFIGSGGYANHLARVRAQYRERRDTLVAALRRHFGAVRLSGESCGMHVMWQLPAGVPEAPRLEELALRSRVGVYSLASAGAHDILATPLMRRSLLLGFACLTPLAIDQGIARLSDVVDDTLDLHPEFVSELMLHGPAPRSAETLRPRAPQRRTTTHPAVRTVRKPGPDHQETTSMRTVRAIYRYPVKGLSPQAVDGIALEAGKPFPFDRLFALARPGVPVDRGAPKWAKKGLFVMLMLDNALAEVRTSLDTDTLLFTIERDGRRVLEADLGVARDREAVEQFFHRLVPGLSAAPTLVRALDSHFMDKPDNVISLINLATVRELEQQWGQRIHPLRFRANFYIDGGKPWEEFDWVGSDIMLGDALLRVDRRNGRCSATNVDPVTGQRDLDIPGTLRKTLGHKDLGVYLVVQKAGKVVRGDDVRVPDLARADSGEAAAAVPSTTAAAAHRGAMICRGCYYIYDPDALAATGAPRTAFDALPAEWRCPDCGTDTGRFHPYLPEWAAEPS